MMAASLSLSVERWTLSVGRLNPAANAQRSTLNVQHPIQNRR